MSLSIGFAARASGNFFPLLGPKGLLWPCSQISTETEQPVSRCRNRELTLEKFVHKFLQVLDGQNLLEINLISALVPLPTIPCYILVIRNTKFGER